MITGIVPIYFRLSSVFFDPRSILSYVSIYFALNFDSGSDPLAMPIPVSTQVGDFFVVDRVYRCCVMTFSWCETLVDLLMLDMVDFDVISGMDRLDLYYAVLYYFAKIMTLSLKSGVPRIAWKGELYSGTKRVISYVQAHRLVKRGCLAYLDHIRDTSVVSTLAMVFVRVVCEFIMHSLIFGSISLDHNIDFAIYVKTALRLFLFLLIGWPQPR